MSEYKKEETVEYWKRAHDAAATYIGDLVKVLEQALSALNAVDREALKWERKEHFPQTRKNIVEVLEPIYTSRKESEKKALRNLFK